MPDNPTPQGNYPIDAVIAWVDGSDPRLAAKRNLYLDEAGGTSQYGVQPTFFASSNEIKYCVLSILTFAPFVRNIFIVTDEQDPGLNEIIKAYFPGKEDTVRIVDHKEIFRGYEQYLPTFNSTSMESMIWRIEGLSENFIYFNDDVFLIRDHQPEDWFRNNRPVLLGKWLLPPYRKMVGNFIKTVINVYLKKNPDYRPKLSFYLRQWNAASLLGMKYRYFFHCHTPHAMNRLRLEKFFTENSALLEKNIANRFRNPDQYIMISLANHLEILDGNRNFAKLNLGYLHPYYSKKRMERRMKRCKNDSGIKSICAQNLDMFGSEVREKIFGWMDQVLDLRER